MQYQNARAALWDLFACLFHPLLLVRPPLVALLEEFPDSLGGLAALSVDVPPRRECPLLVAAAFLYEVVLASMIDVQ